MENTAVLPTRRMVATPDAALHVGVAPQTLARWRVEGLGPAFHKLGGRVRYDVAELDRWLDAQLRTSTADPGPQVAA